MIHQTGKVSLSCKAISLVLLLAVLRLLTGNGEETPAINIGSRLELFVDGTLIERLQGAQLRLNHPVDAGVALKFDRPWEGAFSGYVTVIKDGPTYRLYYRCLPVAGQDGNENEATCYAESTDGIQWTKPELGIFELMGPERTTPSWRTPRRLRITSARCLTRVRE